MDLAKLVVRLEAQSSQLLNELDKANSKLNGFERKTGQALDRINKKFSSFGFGIKAALGAFLGGVSFNAVISATADATEQFAKLENAVAKAGDAAGGRSAKDFADSARAVANLTTVAGGAVQNVQQLLLRFQNIRTDRFDEATARVLDLSQALGVDLDTAAKTVGRALSDPIKGVQALAKAGVVFGENQKEVIKDLVETGRRAEAQGIVLDELADRFGGAAEAARGNFGGALKAVKNALGDLMEAEDGLPGATESLNELAKTLQDPSVRAGADALFSTLIRGAAGAANILGKTAAGVEAILSKGNTRVAQLQKQLDFLIEQRDSVKLIFNFGGKSDIFPEGGFDVLAAGDIDKKIAELEGEMNKILGLGIEGIETAKVVKKTFDSIGSAFELPDIEVVDNTAELAAAAEKLQKQLEAQGKTLTEQVQSPLEKYNAEVRIADQLLAANTITLETWAKALGAARGKLDELGSGMLEVNERFKTLDEQAEEGIKIDVDESTASSIEAQMDEALKDFDKVLENSTKKSTVFAEQAARNVQDILADGIVDGLQNGFEDGAKGALQAFGDMLEKMAAQAIAADIAGAIFGEDPGGVTTNGGGGLFGKFTDWLGSFGKGGAGAGAASGGDNTLSNDSNPFDGILNFASSFFGSMDSGGHGAAGVPVMIGRGAQPELFVPDGPGEFYPAGTYGGGSNVTQNIYTTSPITQRSARQIELEASKRQRIASARLG